MPTDAKSVGVGFIGSPDSVQHLRERICLRQDFATISCHIPGDPAGTSTTLDACNVHATPDEVIRDDRTQVVYFAGNESESLVSAAIQQGKHVILEAPPIMSAGDLRSISKAAAENRVLATVAQPRYWTEDFTLAWQTLTSNQCGKLERIRLVAHETALPGDEFPRGVLRELGYHSLDQLLHLVHDEPQRVHLRKFCRDGSRADSGFLAAIDFVHGTSAVIELQTRSVLSFRTGWMIEGSNGAYRSGRFYSRTPDGEIIDEPVDKPKTSSDPFFDALHGVVRGATPDATSLLPGFDHAARVLDLIDSLEQAAYARTSSMA